MHLATVLLRHLMICVALYLIFSSLPRIYGFESLCTRLACYSQNRNVVRVCMLEERILQFLFPRGNKMMKDLQKSYKYLSKFPECLTWRIYYLTGCFSQKAFTEYNIFGKRVGGPNSICSFIISEFLVHSCFVDSLGCNSQIKNSSSTIYSVLLTNININYSALFTVRY